MEAWEEVVAWTGRRGANSLLRESPTSYPAIPGGGKRVAGAVLGRGE
jgi:hypothetical protein